MDSASATQSQVLYHPGLSSQLATKAGIASRRKGESPDPLSNDFFKGNNTVQKQPSTNKVDSRGGTPQQLHSVKIKNSTFITTNPPMAPREQPSAVFQQEEDDDICIDLTKLAQQEWTNEEQQTTAPAVQQPAKKPNYDLSPRTLTSGQDGSFFRNHNIARPSLLKQPRQKKVDHHSLHDASRISKTIRLPKEPTRQRKLSKNCIGSRYKSITEHDNTASLYISTPNKTSDPNPHYQVGQEFSFSRSTPLMEPKLMKTCPRPPTAALMFDSKAYFPYQLDMARHLAYNGVSGPYELGEYLVDIHMGTAQPVKIARRDTGEYGQPVWRHLITGDQIMPRDGSKVWGTPVALSNGALLHMKYTNGTRIVPQWGFSQPREWHSQEWPEMEKPEEKQHSAQQEANPFHLGVKPGCNPMW